jgi:hypothetical protein
MRPLADTEMTAAQAPQAGPYGHICPGCNARYGAPQAGGVIDVTRCRKCHKTLAEIHQYDEAIRTRQRHWREKVSRKK